MSTAFGATGRAHVELRLPADPAYVSVLRTTSAGLAARLDFTLDDIEDLRIAVGEACALVLPEAAPDADLTSRFWLGSGELTVTVTVPTEATAELDTDSFAWQVLTTLADAAFRADDDACTVTLSKSSDLLSHT